MPSDDAREAARIFTDSDSHVRCWAGVTRRRAELVIESTDREALERFANFVRCNALPESTGDESREGVAPRKARVRGPYSRLVCREQHAEGEHHSGAFGEGSCRELIRVYRYGRYNYRDVRAIALLLRRWLDKETCKQFRSVLHGYRDAYKDTQDIRALRAINALPESKRNKYREGVASNEVQKRSA